MVQRVKGQFYLLSILLILLILLPILTITYPSVYTKTEKKSQTIRMYLRDTLKSLYLYIAVEQARIPAGNRDIILAIETSGGTGSFFPDIQNGTKTFFDCAYVSDRVLLFQFPYCPSRSGCGCDVSALTTFLQLTEENKTYLKNIVDGLEKWGQAPMTFTLDETGQLIDQADPNRNRMIVLLAASKDICAEDPCPIINSLIPSGVPVHTIGYKTSGALETELNCISNGTDGQHYNPTTGDDLNRVFCNIAKGQEPRIEEFFRYVKEQIGERLMDLSFDVSYTFLFSTELIKQDTNLKVKYFVENYEDSKNMTFNYTLYENEAFLTSGTENFELVDNYTNEITEPLKQNTNYTSIAYLNTSVVMVKNNVTLPFDDNRVKLEVYNLLVKYNVTIEGTFVSESLNIPAYVLTKY